MPVRDIRRIKVEGNNKTDYTFIYGATRVAASDKMMGRGEVEQQPLTQ